MTWGQRFARVVTVVVVRAPFLWPLLRGRLTRMFDAIAPHWDAMTSADRMTAFEAGLELVPETPQRVLDLGTGTGDGALAMVRRWPDAEVLGIDAAPAMVEEARRKAGGAARFEVGDARHLDFADGAFDLVAMNNMIPFFGELGRVVAPGGHLVVAFSQGSGTPIWVGPRKLRRGLERAGFEVVRDLAAGPGTTVLARRRRPV
ncbi:MAG: methyltransferase domain-containing protein [Gaiellaceae bacterium]